MRRPNSLFRFVISISLLSVGYLSLGTTAFAQSCGGENQPACTTAPANFVKRTYCSGAEIYDPRNGGECWSCPSGYGRTLFPVDSPKACSKAGYEELHAAVRVRKNTYVGQGCEDGHFWDVVGGDGLLGACYSCDGSRRTGYAITDSRACAKDHLEQTTGANFQRNVGCNNGSFFDPRAGGECWSCPQDFDRGAFAPVTAPNACVARQACASGLYNVAGTCRSDPRPTDCGREGQQACKLWEFIPSCADGLMESPKQGGKCIQPPDGVDPFWGTLQETGELMLQSADRRNCRQTLSREAGKARAMVPPSLMRLAEQAVPPNALFVPSGFSKTQCVTDMSIGFACEVPYIVDNFVALYQSAAPERIIKGFERDYTKWRNSKVCQDAVRDVADAGPEVQAVTGASCAVGLMMVGDTIDSYACSFGLLGSDGISLHSGKSKLNLCMEAGRAAYMITETQLQDKILEKLTQPLREKFISIMEERRLAKAATAEEELLARKVGEGSVLGSDEVDEIQQQITSKYKTDQNVTEGFLKKLDTIKKALDRVGLIIQYSPQMVDRALQLPACRLNVLGQNNNPSVVPATIPATFQLRVQASGQCLGMGGSGDNGSVQSQSQCDVQNVQQHYQASHRGAGFYALKNVASGRCLSIDRALKSDGARTVNADCVAGAPEQLWDIQESPPGQVRLVAKHSRKCLDLTGGSSKPGTPFEEWQCVPNHPNQNFELIEVPKPVAEFNLNAPRPMAATDFPRYLTLQLANSRYCLDTGDNGKDGDNIKTWDCDSKNPNQIFKPNVQQNGAVIFSNPRHNKCLGRAEDNAGSHPWAYIWDCGQVAHAGWLVETFGNGFVRLINQDNGQCLTLKHDRANARSIQFETRACATGASNQTFKLFATDVVPSPLSVKMVNSGKCLDSAGNTDAGANQIIWDCVDGHPNQMFDTVPFADGSYHLRNRTTGNCLGVNNAASDNGTALIGWPCNAGPPFDHRWTPRSLPNGNWQWQNKQTGKCLDNFGGQDNGAVVKQWDCLDHPNQRLKIAAARDDFGGPIQIVMKNDESKCLDVGQSAGYYYGNDTPQLVWSCGANKASQLYDPILRPDGTIKLRSQIDNLCLGIHRAAEDKDSAVIVANCSDAADDQVWQPIKLGGDEWKLRNLGTGKCLDNFGSGNNGNWVRQWECVDHINQIIKPRRMP